MRNGGSERRRPRLLKCVRVRSTWLAAAKGGFPPHCRCFRAWQWFVQIGAQHRRHLAHRRVRTLRICLRQWMETKRLQASVVTKVTQLALYWQKAGESVGNTGDPFSPTRAPISPVELRKNAIVGRTLLSWAFGGGKNLASTRGLGGVPRGSKP